MDYIILIIFVALVHYVGKSLYDVFTNPVLSQREKTNASYAIVTLPVIGSMLFYFYLSRRKAPG
ncbi:MAG TPA: hypothetical protein PK325_07150 [Cyclobacteriaceae bacterium]|nr:hypothetical protein [Cyclobacteriaceae bacterium]HMV09410.1 hypothetical protein [Cyclobacteriaceae bacterium]HMX02431.1 hypothetical protein [Cyclobacteriaceae bacterium]HMX51081.1 hypothetical protein [Cyclobacteriaceae bacterium]HMY91743.1 hypothetical protein [Cyclobacteriaceae bacterium]